MPLPPKSLIASVSATLNAKNKEAARALPSSKGGETPKQLQTYRTDIFTYFTEVGGTRLLYSAENWVRIKLKLKTAGPVAIGTSASLTPVLAGHGILLDTNEEFEVHLAKGARIYVTAETVNRINVTIEPIPWLEQLDKDTIESEAGVKGAVMAIGSSIVDAIRTLTSIGAAATSSTKAGKHVDQLPCPPPDRMMMSRLTPIGRGGRLR